MFAVIYKSSRPFESRVFGGWHTTEAEAKARAQELNDSAKNSGGVWQVKKTA